LWAGSASRPANSLTSPLPQREHRLRAGPQRRHFDIVDRGAGPLRDARHRGGLRGPTLCLSERDDPIGAFPETKDEWAIVGRRAGKKAAAKKAARKKMAAKKASARKMAAKKAPARKMAAKKSARKR
jgi:hypothetical protein